MRKVFSSFNAGWIAGLMVALSAVTSQAVDNTTQSALADEAAKPGLATSSGTVVPASLSDKLAEVPFDTSSAVVKKSAHASLDRLVTVLKNSGKARLIIVGYADNTGKGPSNIDLAKKRANMVSKYFVDQGIDASRISTQTMGEVMTRSENTTVSSRQSNRKAIVTVIE